MVKSELPFKKYSIIANVIAILYDVSCMIYKLNLKPTNTKDVDTPMMSVPV